jgi:hypothetical protein
MVSERDFILRDIVEHEPEAPASFYLLIVMKQIGRLAHNVLTQERFPHIKQSRESLKLTLGQALIDLRQLTIQLGYDPNECEKLGLENLEEQIQDFKKDGCVKVE